jgi:bla regulator protein blaR1
VIPQILMPIANHLWQSSLFAGAAGLLTQTLRKNRASLRHTVWLVASAKFLVPLSCLIDLGSHWGSRAARGITQAAISSPMSAWVDELGQPFRIGPPTRLLAPPLHAPDRTAAILLALWLSGFLVSVLIWLRAWMRVRAAARTASPIEIDCSSAPVLVPIKECRRLLEPCVVGIWRPVLLLPSGIRERLTLQQLDAILRHELCHLRRGDNLAAAVHMAVETIFWFFPLVYWIGSRLMEAREAACDEEVLRSTGAPEIYADSILTVCRFCLSAPLCAAGVTGSNLKRRIEAIMEHRGALPLGLGKKALLAAAAVAALAGPIAVGVIGVKPGRAQSAPEARPSFEVASVKLVPDDHGTGPRIIRCSYGPQGVDFGGLPLGFVIAEAYHIWPGRILLAGGVPKGILNGPPGFDIVAKTDHPVSRAQLRLMLQSLLADRFQFRAHQETRTGPVYRLVVANGGPKLDASQEGGDSGDSIPGVVTLEGVEFHNAEMLSLAARLSSLTGRMVVDETGLTGFYNFVLKVPEELRRPAIKSDIGTAEGPSPAAFADALKQLGLQLTAGTGAVEYLVVDHVERPTAN